MFCALSEKGVDSFQRWTSYLVAVLPKECVAVLIGLYKKNGAVLCVHLSLYYIRHFTHKGGFRLGK